MTDTTTINDTISQFGYSMTFVCTDPGAYDRGSTFQITITRNGQSYTFPYFQGTAHRVHKRSGEPWKMHYGRPTVHDVEQFNKFSRPSDPSLSDVLYCLVSDASSVRNGEKFEDWANELGYNPDSRQDEKCFNACLETWRALLRLGADFEELEGIFQDY